jgi:hypothetical protein
MSHSGFLLSRIYAEGWNAANSLSADESETLDPAKLAALNPYATQPEKARWNEGFTKALGN